MNDVPASLPLQTAAIGTLRLENGEALAEVSVAYLARGHLAPDRRNAVLVTHGYTSGPRMIESGATTGEGSWSGLVGPGAAIDTDRFFVICPNMIGSSYGSTGPASIDPATARPYGPSFPDISVGDIVAAERALLSQLGIEHLVAVIGPSYGGTQAFQWAVTCPDFMDAVVPVVSSPRARPADLQALIDQLARDPNWNGGDYYDRGGMIETMTEFRIATLRTYGLEARLAAEIPDRATRERRLRALAHRWAMEFDPNSLIVLRRAALRFTVEPVLDRIRAPLLYVLSRTDTLFPPSLAPGVMAALKQAGVKAEYFEIDSDAGHLGSGIDWQKWASRLAEFLGGIAPAK